MSARALLPVLLLTPLLVVPQGGATTLPYAVGRGELFASHDGIHLTASYVVLPSDLGGSFYVDYACTAAQVQWATTRLVCHMKLLDPSIGGNEEFAEQDLPGPVSAARGRDHFTPLFSYRYLEVCAWLVDLPAAKVCAARVV